MQIAEKSQDIPMLNGWPRTLPAVRVGLRVGLIR